MNSSRRTYPHWRSAWDIPAKNMTRYPNFYLLRFIGKLPFRESLQFYPDQPPNRNRILTGSLINHLDQDSGTRARKAYSTSAPYQ